MTWIRTFNKELLLALQTEVLKAICPGQGLHSSLVAVWDTLVHSSECVGQILAPLLLVQLPADSHPGRQRGWLKCLSLYYLHGKPELSS